VRRQKSILHMTLEREWFEQIAAGTKDEEFRECKPYWEKRLVGRSYDVICFRNGYGKNVPEMWVEFRGVRLQRKSGKTRYAIRLGRVIKVRW
jgi:hypothetical protein